MDDGSCIAGGCTYANAANYDPTASFDDGSCTFEGCTDEAASNYCPLALDDDGSCEYDSCAGSCPGHGCRWHPDWQLAYEEAELKAKRT